MYLNLALHTLTNMLEFEYSHTRSCVTKRENMLWIHLLFNIFVFFKSPLLFLHSAFRINLNDKFIWIRLCRSKNFYTLNVRTQSLRTYCKFLCSCKNDGEFFKDAVLGLRSDFKNNIFLMVNSLRKAPINLFPVMERFLVCNVTKTLSGG